MKKIELSGNKGRGLFLLVDDDDFVEISKHKWYPFFYKYTCYAQRKIKLQDGRFGAEAAHRQVLNAKKGEVVDHIDHDGLNCQKNNIRICTRARNAQNRIIQKNKSGFKGVHIQRSGLYQATISYNKKKITIGTFATPEDAARAYDIAAIKHHGEFAYLNLPNDNREVYRIYFGKRKRYV
jgi:hypothetical protein